MIEVRLERSMLRSFENEVHASLKILVAARDAGIPTLGTICLLGVRDGALALFNDDEQLVLQWTPPTARAFNPEDFA